MMARGDQKIHAWGPDGHFSGHQTFPHDLEPHVQFAIDFFLHVWQVYVFEVLHLPVSASHAAFSSHVISCLHCRQFKSIPLESSDHGQGPCFQIEDAGAPTAYGP